MGMFLKLDRYNGDTVWVNPLSIDVFRKDPYADDSKKFDREVGSLIETRSGAQFQINQKPEEIEAMIETWVSEAVYDLPEEELPGMWEQSDLSGGKSDAEDEPYTGAMPEDQG